MAQLIDSRLHWHDAGRPVIRVYLRYRDGSCGLRDYPCTDEYCYFYVETPGGYDLNSIVHEVNTRREKALEHAKKCSGPCCQPKGRPQPCLRDQQRVRCDTSFITRCVPEMRRSVVGFSRPVFMWKVHVQFPWNVYPTSWAIRKTMQDDRYAQAPVFYELDVDVVTRWMIHHGLVGMGWIDPAPLDHPVPLPDVSNAPLVTVALDIECMATREGVFCAPDQDPVIQIACVMTVYGQDAEEATVFVLDTCEDVPSAEVRSFDSEGDLLKAFFEYINDRAPDLITGYNSNAFDLPYLFKRHRIVNRCSRVRSHKDPTSFVTETVQTAASKQSGGRERHQWNWTGCVVLDVLEVVRAAYKLSSYKLNAVARHFLHQQEKDDLPYAEIPRLQKGSAADRARMARYCVQDTRLVVLLTAKLQLLVNNVELTRVVGCRFQDTLDRMQSHKVRYQVLRHIHGTDFVLPTFDKVKGDGDDAGTTIVPYYNDIRGIQQAGQGDTGFMGATVLEPVRGFHKDPVAVLDFASLYPSIIMAHNLSHDTLLKSEEHARELGVAYTKSPNGYFFVHKDVQVGILPAICANLLAARKRAKKQMKEATDPFTKAVYDGKQLGLKICCNSVYGFCGASKGALPCVYVSAAVTSFGRSMILDSKRFVETHYNATVCYGDTDSIFFSFPGHLDTRQTYEKALEVERHINGPDGLFQKPINLEYEKVFVNMLLLAKKRYCALKVEDPDKPGKLDYKGLELARRDNCPLCKETMSTFLDWLIAKGDADRALRSVADTVRALVHGEYSVDQYVVTKSLTKTDYVNPQIHVSLAKRVAQRAPGTEPKLGDRVPYVIISGDEPLHERGELPSFVVDQCLSLDYAWYLEKQIVGPMTRLIEPLVGAANTRQFFERALPDAQWLGTDGQLVSGCWIPPLQAQQETNTPVAKRRKVAAVQKNKLTAYFR